MRPIRDGLYRTGLENELDKQVAQKGADYCGSCFGGLEPPNGCCNTCDEVRQAYSDRGWAFGNPDSIDQVSILRFIGTPNTNSLSPVCGRALDRKDQGATT
jgi:hypothetical protein